MSVLSHVTVPVLTFVTLFLTFWEHPDLKNDFYQGNEDSFSIEIGEDFTQIEIHL